MAGLYRFLFFFFCFLVSFIFVLGIYTSIYILEGVGSVCFKFFLGFTYVYCLFSFSCVPLFLLFFFIFVFLVVFLVLVLLSP